MRKFNFHQKFSCRQEPLCFVSHMLELFIEDDMATDIYFEEEDNYYKNNLHFKLLNLSNWKSNKMFSLNLTLKSHNLQFLTNWIIGVFSIYFVNKISLYNYDGLENIFFDMFLLWTTLCDIQIFKVKKKIQNKWRHWTNLHVDGYISNCSHLPPINSPNIHI